MKIEKLQIFTADDIALMGDYSEQFGQSYWGSVKELDHPVRFNMKKVVDFVPGRQFVAGEYEERTSKGSNKPYMQLYKIKLSEPTTEETEEIGDEEIEAVEEQETAEAPGHAKAVAARDEIASRTTSTAPGVAINFTLEDEGQTAPGPEVPSYEAGTNARWALKLSVDTFKAVLGRVPDSDQDWGLIEDFAKWLLGAFGRLKSYDPNKDPVTPREED